MRPRRIHLPPPVSYQGGKRRQAPEIVRHMGLDPETPFYDLCCGSGAVSLELISRGHNPAKITMVDAGPWGDVWRLVGAGEFDIERLLRLSADLLDDALREQLDRVAARVQPSHADAPYAFLLFQSASFGGKAVGEASGQWRRHSICSPREVDGYPVRPWNPAPEIMAERIGAAMSRCAGVTGVRADVAYVVPRCGAVVYLDPPYAGTAGYGDGGETVKPAALAATWSPCPVYVSERSPLSGRYVTIQSRRGSNISAINGSATVPEYLSLFNADWPTPEVEKWEHGDLFAEVAPPTQ